MLGQLLMRIVMVADTGIVEQGPHDELVARRCLLTERGSGLT
ncbi:hypothetical protein BQ8482_310047 [Mesorhizobium delmotii]|uniref:Uncharacterized protein n=1 Tax=Mesorhizobium delmotii TaxID=1631247 RepID=A0A2P9ANK8_9HYPH|nr:hypothetical protein BQ8482_310047 [Mesorhizobium delmotii]